MMRAMRTTVTIEDDIAARLESLRRERGLSFKEALNDTLRAGLQGRQRVKPYKLPTYDMGPPLVDLTKALQLAAELEDEEIIRKMQLGK
jgi:hypothetical protein